jgi:RNA polymerase sigma-70 factor (ECF subfamily)
MSVDNDIERNGKLDGKRFVERLVREHNGDLMRYLVRRANSQADAADIVQEVYIRMLRLDRKELIRTPLAYLYRVAANILGEFQLKQRSDQELLLRWKSPEEGDQNGDPLYETLALSRKVEATLAQLSPKCRAVVILHRQHGMTYEEIGKALGISSGMVKKYLIQGVPHCCNALADWV